MKLKRMVFLLLALALFLSLCSLGASATDEGDYLVPETRKRDNYSYYSSEELMELFDLDEAELKSLQERIYESILSGEGSCTILDYRIPISPEAQNALYYLFTGHPELGFMLRSSISFMGRDGCYNYLSYKYRDTYDEAMQRRDEFLTMVDEFLCPFLAAEDLSDLELALLVHDELVQQCTYDTENLTGDLCYTAYGALVLRKAVCDGYQDAYAYLMNRLGITCGMCKSEALNHAWNIIEIDGEEYHVDCTWDDPIPDHSGRAEHADFMLSSTALKTNHDANDFTGNTTSTKYDNAFWKNFKNAFCLVGNDIYYVNSGLYQWADGKSTYVTTIPSGAKYLDTDGENLYMMTTTRIYIYKPASKSWMEFYKPSMPSGHSIQGYYVDRGKLYIETYTGASYTPSVRDKYQIVYDFKGTGTNHVYDSGKVTKTPTCVEDGVMTYTCTGCGCTRTEVLPKGGHVNTELRNGRPATCTEDGYSGDVYCFDCNEIVSYGNTIAARHNYKETNRVEPTCTENGTVYYICSVCNDSSSETLPATGHLNTELRGQIPATQGAPGYSGDTYCLDCGKMVEEGNITAPVTSSREDIVGIWLWSSVIYNRGEGSAEQVLRSMSESGITDVYLLVKGTSGKLYWPSKVEGGLVAYPDRDILQEVIDAAKPYGIRVHAWMMAALDDHYLSNNPGADYYHATYGQGSSKINNHYINLRKAAYQNHVKALVAEIRDNYDVAGFHLDTIRYGSILYDWCDETKNHLINNYGITATNYNNALTAAKNGTYASYLTGTSSTAVGMKAVAQMRTDTTADFVKMVGDTAGDGYIITVAVMPESLQNAGSETVYGQSAEKFAKVTDYICPMAYSVEFGKTSAWVAELCHNAANAGANVVAGIQAYSLDDNTKMGTGQTVYNDVTAVYDLAEEINNGDGKGEILGVAIFRDDATLLTGARYNPEDSTITFTLHNQYSANKVSSSDMSKVTIALQNGMTIDTSRFTSGLTGKEGWLNTPTFTVSGNTLTISASGKTIMAAGNGEASITVAVKGTPHEIKPPAMVRAYCAGTSYLEYSSYCGLLTGSKHDYEGRKLSDPTCTEPGIIAFVCKDCGDTFEYEIPALGHGKTQLVGVVAKTCTTNGYTGDTLCTVCNAVLKKGTVILATHAYGDAQITPATCTSDGILRYDCTVCGNSCAEGIPATGHGTTELRGAKEASADATGYSGDLYCVDCGAKLASGSVLPATGSESTDGIVAAYLWATALDTRSAEAIVKEYAKLGFTDIYFLVKGTDGMVSWQTNVAGAVEQNGSRDYLEEICAAAAPYGIRIHAWMMTGRDKHYTTNVNTSARAKHFRDTYTDSTYYYVNLRNQAYMDYTKALIEELVANYDIAGIHLDTMRYGTMNFDWGKDMLDAYLLGGYGTVSDYNEAVKALCREGSFKYKSVTGSTPGYNNGASYTYYVWASSGTTPSSGYTISKLMCADDYYNTDKASTTVHSGSGVVYTKTTGYLGVRGLKKLRIDTVTNFVAEVKAAAGDKLLTMALMPESGNSNEAGIYSYGQYVEELVKHIDYAVPTTYTSEYGTSTSWPVTVAQNCIKRGCPVVAAIQINESTGSTHPTTAIIDEEVTNVVSAMASNSKLLGYAFSRTDHKTLFAVAKYVNGSEASVEFYVANQSVNVPFTATKLVFKLNDGLTVDTTRGTNGILSDEGFTGTCTFTVSSDKKTVTIHRSGSGILSTGADASFRIAVKGTPTNGADGIADVQVYSGSSYGTEQWGYCFSKLGHKHSYIMQAPTADCSAEAVATYTCDCGHSYTQRIPAAPHHYDTGVITKVPTCGEDGEKTLTCLTCGTTKTVTYSETMAHGKTTETRTEPTCTEKGRIAQVCTICGKELSAEEIPALGHSSVIDKAVASTCTATGLTEGKHCSVCNAVLTAQETVPATGHSYSYTKVDDQTHTIGCKNCSLSETAPHSYQDGFCICGAEEAKEPVLETGWKIGHTLNLASDISVTMAISKASLSGFDMDTVYVLSELDIYEGNVKIGVKTIEIRPEDKGSYYYFTLTGLTAVHTNDQIRSVLYGTKDGQIHYSPVDEYSIATYAYAQMNKANAALKLKTLCAELLRYGSKAQIFKGYRTDALVDANMTEEHRALLSDMEAVTFGNTNTTENIPATNAVQWLGKSLDLASKVSIKFIFSLGSYTGNTEDLQMKVTYKDINGKDKELTISQVEVYNQSRGYYAFTLDSLLAAELRSVLTVQILSGETVVSGTVQYAADTYGNGKDGALGNLCKALFAYSDSAKAYFAS